MTMVCVTHEMGFAREAADGRVYGQRARSLRKTAPKEFFAHPQHERTKLFLSQILR